MGKWLYWLQIAGVCWGCHRSTPQSQAEPIASAESSASVLSAVPAPAPENAKAANERNCIDDAAGRANHCRSACGSVEGDADDGSECRRECLAQFAREQHGCSEPGLKPLPWFDLYASGARPGRSELARKLEDAVLSAGTGCDVHVSAERLPTLLLWATVDGEGTIAEASVHPLENVDGHDVPACLEHELSRKRLPATSGEYSFVSPIIVPGRAFETHTDSALGRRPVAAAARPSNVPSRRPSSMRSPSPAVRDDTGSVARSARQSSLTDAESREVEKITVGLMQGMTRELKKYGEPQPSAENCATVRRNLEFVRSGGLARRLPHLKKDPNYEQRLQETIRAGEEAERRFCR